MPQTGHGLTGTSYSVDGEGRKIPASPIPNRYDQLGLLFDWVENGAAPGMSVTVTAGDRSLPLCSYPSYPRYRKGIRPRRVGTNARRPRRDEAGLALVPDHSAWLYQDL